MLPPEVIEQRELVEQLVTIVKRIGDLNNIIGDIDKNLACDFSIQLCQHRHAFEEQQVSDHSNCVSFQAIGGNMDGIIAGLVAHCTQQEDFTFCFTEAYKFLILKFLTDGT